MTACTIIARNYLAQARVLAESYLTHHPGSRFFTLIIDGPGPPGGEPFEAVGPLEIGLDAREFHRMAGIYDVMELSTAVKPWFLQRLRQETADEIVYLDPDIRVFASLEPVSKLAREHSIVLTPHAPAVSPHDRTLPGETTFLLAGIYNLGFIAVGPGSDPFLNWWAERVARDCIVAPDRGHFVDQRWVDFVPALFDHFILRDPAYNVAWWNLPGRTMSWTGKRYTVDGKQLRFFHFSGFDPRSPHILSKHQGPAPRTLLSERPDIARICNEYAQALFDAGFTEVSRLPYRYDTGPAGLAIDARMRRLYRSALMSAEERGDSEPPNPYDDEPAFLAWLRASPDSRGGAAHVNRYLQALYRERPDLQAAFPDLRWVNGDRFLDWAVAHGQEEEGIPLELLPDPHSEPASAARRSDRRTGVNVAGYFRAEGGVGEAARGLISALDAANLDFAAVNYEETPNRQEHPFAHADSAPRYDVNVICVNADRLPEFAYDMGPEFFADRYSIGLWWWELSRFPERFHHAFDIVQEIWVGSDFVAEAVARETAKPVRVFPLGVEPRVVEPGPRSALGLPDGFQFLFSFDFYSVFERKNPLAVVEAFKAAFEPGEGPSLVLKSINGDKRLVELERLRAAADRPDIVVLDGYVSADEKDGLMNGCDCYVSLHRSEGFGLTMAEAMALGKPVVATEYSGNLTFMDASNSYLVPFRPASVPSGCNPYPAGVEWAEPDVREAAELLRYVFEHQDEAREMGARAREHMLQHHSRKQGAEFVAARLREIRLLVDETPADDAPAAPGVDAGRQAAEASSRYVHEGPSIPWDAPARLGPPARLGRRFVRRLLRPYTLRHQELDAAMVEVAGAHQRALEELRDMMTRAHEASVLANAETRAEVGAAEQRVSMTQRRQFDRLRQVEQLFGALNESIGAQSDEVARTRQFEDDVRAHLESIDSQLASVIEQLGAQVREVERTREFEQAVRRRFPGIDGTSDNGSYGSEPDVGTFGERYSPPDRPWTHDYEALHRRLVSEALDDARFVAQIAAGDPLPPGYGVGFDERVVEFPWLLAQQPSGRLLDAGSALNHAHVLDRVRPRVTTLDIVTLVPEELAFTDKDVSYVYADLRNLPYRDGHFTTVVSVSTLEHVGMDNTIYGVEAPRAANPTEEMRLALAELVRVTAPGGVVLVTVPFGRREDHGWLRQFDRDDVDELVSGVPARRTSCSIYRYSREGWQVSDFAGAADCEYRDYLRDPRPVDDLAAAARAVVCIRFDLE
ncbi:MAG TPA: glycosyltransferase [Gaiellaceae bacterium]|nr:glycosyltransferase [Gaiellaceae bacterium]